MPRFYFQFHGWVGGQGTAGYSARTPGEDDALDLPDVASAQIEALEASRELLIDAIRRGDAVRGCRFNVADRFGNVILTVSFDGLVELTSHSDPGDQR
jgi:hypothetical protein